MEIALILLFLLVSVLMILVILIQKPKGGGLSGAFGGGGGGQTAFGSKTGDVVTWFTTACFVLFLVLGILLTWYIDPQDASGPSGVIQPTTNSAAPIDDPGAAAPSAPAGDAGDGAADQTPTSPVDDASQ